MNKGEVFLSLNLDIDIIVSILLKLVKALTKPTRKRMNPIDSCINSTRLSYQRYRKFNLELKLWYEYVGSVECCILVIK